MRACCKRVAQAFGIAGLCTTVGLGAQVNLTIRAQQPSVAQPVCVRAEILKSDGTYLEGEWLTPGYPVVELHGKAMSPGNPVQVPSGLTRITIGRGPDYKPQTITTNLTGDTTLNVILQPVFDLYNRGWRSSEMHLHYIHGEGEIIRTPQQAWAICSGGGLDSVLFCEEHYGAGTLTRQQMYDLWTPFASTETKLGMGVEEPKNAWGHYENSTYDPWSVRSAPPYYWGIRTVHEQGSVAVPVHPGRMFPSRYYDDPSSGSRFWYLFPFNNFLKSYPVDVLIGHLMDGWSGVSDEPYTTTVLPPYFQLLNSGYRIPLMADSDFCMDRINNGGKATGFWMTYCYLGGEPVSRAAIGEAIRRGRVMATTGPLVLFTIDNAISGDTLPADGAARTVHIDASYSFNPWTLKNTKFDGSSPCQIVQIDLFRNGQIIQTWIPNIPTASVQRTITESSSNSWYMVRVLGNQSQWMAGYASPIYFGAPDQRRKPPVFKTLVQGRLYDAVSGNSLTGTVSSVRYGTTEWIIPTDAQGRFQARVPLDAELVAADSAGRSFTQSIMKQESVYRFCNYLAENYSTNQEASVSALSNIVAQMRWEFPLGYQLSPSYVRTTLSGEASMSGFSVLSAPAHTGGKSSAEIAMVIIDKTRVQPGDTINFTVIYHSPQNPPTGLLAVEWKGWNSNNPSMYNKFSQNFGDFNNSADLVNLGGGFYLRSGSVVIPDWVSNNTPTTGGVLMYVTVRPAGNISEDTQLLLPLGPTRRELLVSTTWDGFPSAWSEVGVGPCNFRRDYTDFLVRYSDYRNMVVRLTLNGQQITLNPKVDTAHVADADDAVFYEKFFYDGQCEPQYRNINFRDPVRGQPSPTDFSSVPINDPADVTAPLAVAIDPANGVTVTQGVTRLYFTVDDAGVSEPCSATVFVDGQAVTNTFVSPVALSLPPGQHTWRVQGFDSVGNSSFSALNMFVVGSSVPDTTPPSVAITAPANGAVLSGTNVPVSATANDNVGVASVQFRLDAANLGAARTAPPYTINWDTTTSGNGSHQLTAVARDLASNQSTSAVVNVTVQGVQGQGCVPAPPGLYAWYKAEGNALDSAGANSGTPVNGVGFPPAKVGLGFNFNGVNSFVALPTNLFPYPTSGSGHAPFSFEVWFSTSTGGVILGQQSTVPFTTPSTYVPAMYVGTDGKLYVAMFWNTYARIISPGPVNNGAFHHVAVTYDGTTEIVYLDGTVIGSQPFTQMSYATVYQYQLGTGYTAGNWPAGNGGWFPFNGIIDEASIYNRALTAAELVAIVGAGSSGKCSGSPPTLTIERNATNVIISRPAAFTGYDVYWSRTLTVGSWQLLTNPVVTTNGRIQVTVPASEREAFFRLLKE